MFHLHILRQISGFERTVLARKQAILSILPHPLLSNLVRSEQGTTELRILHVP